MANTEEELQHLAQSEAEGQTPLMQTQHLQQRGDTLAQFQSKISNRAESRSTTTDTLDANLNMHRSIDLFTHSHLIKRKPSDDKIRHGVCKRCFDPSTSMDMKYWEPANHEATLQHHPSMAKRERRDRMKIKLACDGGNDQVSYEEMVDKEWKTTFEESDIEDVEQPVNGRIPRRIQHSKKPAQKLMQKAEGAISEAPSKPFTRPAARFSGNEELMDEDDDIDTISSDSGSFLPDSSFRDGSSPVKAPHTAWTR